MKMNEALYRYKYQFIGQIGSSPMMSTIQLMALLTSLSTTVASDFYARDCCHGQVIDMKIPGFDWDVRTEQDRVIQLLSL